MLLLLCLWLWWLLCSVVCSVSVLEAGHASLFQLCSDPGLVLCSDSGLVLCSDPGLVVMCSDCGLVLLGLIRMDCVLFLAVGMLVSHDVAVPLPDSCTCTSSSRLL